MGDEVPRKPKSFDKLQMKVWYFPALKHWKLLLNNTYIKENKLNNVTAYSLNLVHMQISVSD